MRETQALVERVRHIGTGIQQIDLSIDQALAQLKPGQSVFARLENAGWETVLREQWLPVNLQRNTLTVEMSPADTFSPGQVVSLLSPVGRAFPARPSRSHVLLIVDDTLPTPLVWLARTLIAERLEVTMVLGGAAVRYPLELLPPEVEILRSDAGWTWPEQVETLNWADQVFVLAPAATQMAVYGELYETVRQIRQQLIPENYLCGVFFQRLACGTGACQACQLPSRKGELLACVDGPAIDLRQLEF